MHNVLPEIAKVCSMIVQKKLIYKKYDEVGIVLFGTKGTKNELKKEVGGYEHVVVFRHIKVVDGDLINAFQQLPRGTVDGDLVVLDAIIVGMDVLIKKFGQTSKGKKVKKHLCLFTSANFPIRNPYEGTKENEVTTIAVQMALRGMKMDSIVFRGTKESFDANKRTIEENDLLLSIFSEKTSSKSLHVDNSVSLLGAVRTRSISPVTIYRGDFELSSKMKIKVWVYKKTAEERFPTLKKYSDKAPPSDKYATHEIKVDYEYKSVEDPSKVVPPDQRVKGYWYGPQVVPLSSDQWETAKFKPEKSVKLLGFTNASKIKRYHYMKDVNFFMAEPGNRNAILSVSALARAMKELNKVAILRCVWRQGQDKLAIGVLTPYISDKDNIADSFYFNVLPFAEDVREFHFPSFGSCPLSLQPNEEQQEAADKLVKVLELAPSGKEEILQPDLTLNPVLERFYCHLELKSKNPNAAVPPLDESLKQITEPDPQLLIRNKPVIDEFCRQFRLNRELVQNMKIDALLFETEPKQKQELEVKNPKLMQCKDFRMFKIQPKVENSFYDMFNCYKKVVWTFIFAVGPLQLLSYPVIEWVGIRTGLPLPSGSEMFWQLLVYFVVEDYANYWLHRLLHCKWGYEKIHRIHHEYTAPIGFAAPYAHWAEIIILGLASFLGPLLVPCHMITFWLWMIVRQMEAVETHSG
ncbi:hypothetical protein LguiA_010292 [Lonicera macranthoides]